MAKKKSTELEPITEVEGGALALPGFMQESEGLGMEELGKFVVPPRIRVVQALSDMELRDAFPLGTVVILPQRVPVAEMVDEETGEPFHFTPLFFFPEWVTWNPIASKGVLPAIVERTVDPNSPLVAKTQNPKLWTEDCLTFPGENIRHVEHLNFVVLILGDHPLASTPVILSFARGEHKAGMSFNALIKMRKALVGCNFMGVVGHRTNNKGDWFGIDVANPAGDSGIPPFVQDEETFENLKALHLELKEAHANQLIRVDYEDDKPTVPSDSGEF